MEVVRINLRSMLALVVSTTLVLVTWCVLLPWIATQPAMKQRLQFLDERGINPSAMYYTELESMPRILDRLEGRSPEGRPRSQIPVNQSEKPDINIPLGQ